MDDLITQTAVFPHLHTRWLGHTYHYFPAIGSTNSYLKAQTTLPHGTVAITDFQEAGRGRFDRVWQAPAGSALLFSVLLHPNWEAGRVGWLGMIAGLAVYDAVTAVAGLEPQLKWPNDVVLWQEEAWRKACGLLVEVEWGANGRLTSAIIGIGLNVNLRPTDLPHAATMSATSLQIAAGQPVARRHLLCYLLQRLEQRYEAADQGESPQREWAEKLVTLGQRVVVTAVYATHPPIEGIAEATDSWGQLLVRDDNGHIHTVTAGDVTLRPKQT
ncbi:MAG: biotin--[acetyl-CoA-carboxylase] ligase [Chloroflexota bacterium]